MPKKKTTKTIEKPAGFNLFDSNIVSHTQEALSTLRAKKKKGPLTLKSMSDISSYILELDNFALQATLGLRGLRGRTVFEMIAQEGIGKTTLVFTLLGALMRSSNAPCLFVNTEGENKLPNAKRIQRCLDDDPKMAERMYNVLELDTGRELRETADFIEDWIKTTREFLNDNGGQEVPIVIAIDTLSKLMSPGEAVGLLDSDTKKSAKAKGLGESSNLEFSKLMHAWCRRLPFILDEYNVLLISVSHQNQKIDMGGFGATMSADVSAGYNKTKRGGKALDQNAAMQITLKRTGFYKNSAQEVQGHKIQMRVVKSSVGADNNILDYILKTKHTEDMPPDYQEPALDFSEGLANMFAEQRLLSTKVARKRYTSEPLGVEGVTASEFVRAFNERPDLKNAVGVALGIDGYLSDEWIEDASLEGEEKTDD